MRVFIDPGHGGMDPGATFNNLVEKEIVLNIGHRLADKLVEGGHLIKMSRTDDIFLNLAFRADRANEWLADVFISLHLNADPDEDKPGMAEAKGYEFWIYPESENGNRLAGFINTSVAWYFPETRARGIKSANFAVLRLTKMPAVLLELAFIDTNESTRLTEDVTQQRLAEAIAQGLDNYSNYEFKGVV